MKVNWKNWMFILALSLLVTGCMTQVKQEQAKNKPKTQSKPAKQSAIQKLGDNKMDVVLFLQQAEHQLENVYYAAADNAKGKSVSEDGLVFRELPKRFDSKDKITGYFGRFWSRPLAEAMYDHMTTKLVKEKVYVAIPRVDYPTLISVRNTTVQKSNGELSVTVEDVTNSSFASDRTLRYRLVRDQKTKRFEIKSRMGAYGNEQFQ
ncbi:hypothetical protein E8L90_28275 [Brevibacillus antibioticus]|uniref:IseA DL-endopeptidase inhibitor n=1 Tax=Brevibacillus antibioticus TaxID=2570228 RepID=A0A4U2YEP8_9BACL|nr:hypothetical protein [Brevibacillus antibioticus]TKI58974.1 hypothetical protein E8L90_28275 [Brevibacillus antibioticus]